MLAEAELEECSMKRSALQAEYLSNADGRCNISFPTSLVIVHLLRKKKSLALGVISELRFLSWESGFAALVCSFIEPTYGAAESWNYTFFALDCSLKWCTYLYSVLKIEWERLVALIFRKIVDHVDWMTSPEQVADAVKRFRYVFYHRCKISSTHQLMSNICVSFLFFLCEEIITAVQNSSWNIHCFLCVLSERK